MDCTREAILENHMTIQIFDSVLREDLQNSLKPLLADTLEISLIFSERENND